MPVIVDLEAGGSKDDLWVHDEFDIVKASILTRFFKHYEDENSLPRPFGVIYQENRDQYQDLMIAQIQQTIEKQGVGDLDQLLSGNSTWEIK